MLTEYMAYLQKKGKSPHTVISYKNDLQQFFDDLHIQPHDYVTETDVRKWVDQLLRPVERKPLATSTINR